MVTAVLPQREPLSPDLAASRTGDGLTLPGTTPEASVLSLHAKRGVGTRPAELTRTQVTPSPAQGQEPPLFKDVPGAEAGPLAQARFSIANPPPLVVMQPAPQVAPTPRTRRQTPGRGPTQDRRRPGSRGPRT